MLTTEYEPRRITFPDKNIENINTSNNKTGKIIHRRNKNGIKKKRLTNVSLDRKTFVSETIKRTELQTLS
jgi:hypothetical protein